MGAHLISWGPLYVVHIIVIIITKSKKVHLITIIIDIIIMMMIIITIVIKIIIKVITNL